jgi:hypothetical protein
MPARNKLAEKRRLGARDVYQPQPFLKGDGCENQKLSWGKSVAQPPPAVVKDLKVRTRLRNAFDFFRKLFYSGFIITAVRPPVEERPFRAVFDAQYKGA